MMRHRIALALTGALLAVLLSVAPAAADEPTVTFKLIVNGPVPPSASFWIVIGTGGEPLCAQSWRDTDVPTCESGKTYVHPTHFPPGTSVEGAIQRAEELPLPGGRIDVVSWEDIYTFDFTMGAAPRTFTVTYWFGGVPDTAAANPSGAPVLGTALVVCAGVLLVVGVRRRSRATA